MNPTAPSPSPSPSWRERDKIVDPLAPARVEPEGAGERVRGS